MQVATFTPQVWKDLEGLRDYAKANIISRQEMEAVAAGIGDPSSADPQYQRQIPGGYTIIYSVHDFGDGTRMRLLTVRLPCQQPAVEILYLLMPFFEIRSSIGDDQLKFMMSPNAIIAMEMYRP